VSHRFFSFLEEYPNTSRFYFERRSLLYCSASWITDAIVTAAPFSAFDLSAADIKAKISIVSSGGTGTWPV
jgi:hypothetical protein